MSDGIPAVVRRNNSIYLWLWGDVQWHSIVLSTLTSALSLIAAYTLVPVQRFLAILSEIQRSMVKTAG